MRQATGNRQSAETPVAARDWKCSVCGYQRKTFAAQCSQCSRWNTFHRGGNAPGVASGAIRLDKAGPAPPRVRTGIPGLDDVLGGGFVPGSGTLLYGGKGAGKSTLAVQAAFWAAVRVRRPSLYVGGEEPWWQISERLERLGLNPSALYFTSDLEAGRIGAEIRNIKPALVVIDSAQKLDLPGRKGSDHDRRVRALLETLKVLRESKVPGLLISQVNGTGKPKGGTAYEHEPDVVLKIAIDQDPWRVLSADKNRFGKLETERLRMTEKGLV